MGRRQGARSGAYLDRYVTDEQRGRRPIFIATLWAAASWLFFRVARSSRIDLDMIVVTASPARTALNNSQRTGGERRACFGDRTLWPNQRVYLQPQKFGERKKLLNVAQTLMSINGG